MQSGQVACMLMMQDNKDVVHRMKNSRANNKANRVIKFMLNQIIVMHLYFIFYRKDNFTYFEFFAYPFPFI